MVTIMLLFLLQLKHFVVDFLWQPEYEWRNKGTWGHPGGINHSVKHALATFLILIFFKTHLVALNIAIFEGFAHYLIDYSKMNINSNMGWKADKNPEFWYLLGLDQFLHQICYCIIVVI